MAASVPRKKGAKVGTTTRGQGTTWRVLVDGAGTPVGADLEAASPAAVMRLESTIDTGAVANLATASFTWVRN
jgi:hypothetical protein